MTSQTAFTPFLRSSGGRIFLVIWFGQMISTIGSSLTSFGLSVWIYQQTGSATLFALNIVAFALPQIALSPFAEVLGYAYGSAHRERAAYQWAADAGHEACSGG